jgi:hypothetical protein
MSTKSEKKPNLISPEAILSFPQLVDPRPSDDGGPAKWSGAFVFTPEAQKTPEYKAMQARAIEVAQAAHPGKNVVEMFKMQSGGIRSPFRRDWESKGYPEGSVFINARTTQRPGVIDTQGNRIAIEDLREKAYAGKIVKVSLNAFYYDRKGNKGVSFGLQNILLVRDGERLDNRAAPETEFTADMSAAPDSIDDVL